MLRCEDCPLAGEPEATSCPGVWHSRTLCEHRKKEAHLPVESQAWGLRIVTRAGMKPKSRPATIKLPKAFAPPLPPDGRVRIGVFSPGAGRGGAEQHISQMFDLCDPEKVRWEGIVIREDYGEPSLKADWREHCEVVIGEGAIPDLARRVDVLYTWGVLDIPWGFSPSQFAKLVPPGLPVISCSQGALEREYTSHNDPDVGLNVTSIAVSKAAIQAIPIPLRPTTRIIHNLAHPDRATPGRPREETRAMLGIPRGVKVAGWLGRLSREKGPWNFARGIAALPDGWVGVMAGIGAEGNAIAAFAATLPPGKLILAGIRDDVGDMLGIYDCLVMCSLVEGCSLAAGEAMLAGKPIITTPAGLYAPDDRPDLARVMSFNPSPAEVAGAILDDAADREGTAVRVAMAREFATVDLGPDRFRDQWTGLFLELATPKSAPAPKPPVPSVRSVAEQSRLSVLRNKCSFGSRVPGCGCTDFICTKHDGRKTREQCFDCLEAQCPSQPPS